MTAHAPPASVISPPPRSGGEHGPPGHSAGGGEHLALIHTKERFFFGFSRAVREVWDYRELLGQLVRKELKVKYKDSVLGFMWTLVRPLMQLLVYSIAIGIFLGGGRTIPQFGVYLFTGLLVWQLFTDIIGGCAGSIISNGGLVKKVYLPRELFPLAVVGAAFINFLLQSVILVGAYILTGHAPSFGQFYLIPLALAVVLLFATALGLVLAATNVFLRDVQYLVEIGLLLWFWMTPIVYDWTKVKKQLVIDHHLQAVYQIYLANPMANVVLAFQRALWPGGQTAKGAAFYYGGNLAGRLLIIGAVSLALVWLGQRIFARSQGNFAQEL